MDSGTVQELLNRALRCRARLEKHDGTGVSWTAKASDGDTHSYIVNGVRPSEDVEDDLRAAFVWLWSLKDHLKLLAQEHGMRRRWIEEQVDSDEYLPLSADVANLIKHGHLDRLRSGVRPVIGELTYSITQTSMNGFTVRAFEVELDTKDHDAISYEWPITDQEGNVLIDGLQLLDHCIRFWEARHNEIESGA